MKILFTSILHTLRSAMNHHDDDPIIRIAFSLFDADDRNKG
jgi:hypothetical protein